MELNFKKYGSIPTDVFSFIADFYLKNGNLEKAIRYYSKQFEREFCRNKKEKIIKIINSNNLDFAYDNDKLSKIVEQVLHEIELEHQQSINNLKSALNQLQNQSDLK